MSLQHRALRRISGALIVLLILLIIGTVGYQALEDMALIDALYMSVITISTVGFGEVKQLSQEGRLFTMFLIVGGGGVAAYSLSTAAEFFLSGEWRVHLERRRHYQLLNQLQDHTIVCGYGRMGRHVVNQIRAQGRDFVVIDTNKEKITYIQQSLNALAVHGDAADENNLHAAGIERASSLVAVANSDAENVFIVLTARSVRSDLLIVARANEDGTEGKLLRAGADRVILPYRISGRRIATLLVRPDVADFLDEVMHTSQLELLVDQVSLSENSAMAGQTLGKAELRTKFGVTVLACRLPGGALTTNISADTVLEPNAMLIVLGTPDQLQALRSAIQEV
jgi:voltage-gated potassium channel